jgi:hypothetical protein
MTIKTHGRMFTDNTVGISQLALVDGSANQAIVTDGQGVLRFATVGAGGSVGSSVYIEDTFTGDGTTATFTLTTAAPYEESVLAFIDGVAQPTASFTLPSTTSITFSPAPGNGAAIRVCHLGIASSLGNNSITGAHIAMGGDTAGDVLYFNGTDYQRLTIGTAGQHLATNSAANAPEWVTPIGQVVKIHHYVNNTYQASAVNAALPVDNTIPQITEGTEFLVFPMTPVSATSTLLIDVNIQLAATSSDEVCAALFVDSTVNALVANTQYSGGGSPREQNPIRIVYKVASTNTVARTYRVRAGQGAGQGLTFCNGSDDTTLNGRYAGRVASTITITEYEE